MPSAIGTSSAHRFVVASEVEVPVVHADAIMDAGAMTFTSSLVVQVLDMYCRTCRRTYDDVAGTSCVGKTLRDRAHLIGGPGPDDRKKKRCELHGTLLQRCAELHIKPLTYGRPLPPLDNQ